jgi:hypothetical protein
MMAMVHSNQSLDQKFEFLKINSEVNTFYCGLDFHRELDSVDWKDSDLDSMKAIFFKKKFVNDEKKNVLVGDLTEHLDNYLDEIPDIMIDSLQINPDGGREMFDYSTSSGA